MNIELADWILAVVAFIAGTVVPALYRRIAHEGFSIRQPIDIRSVQQDPSNRNRSEVVFSTVVKIVNARARSLILDEIRAGSIGLRHITFDFLGVDAKKSQPGEAINLPPPNAVSGGDLFPFLIEPNTECLVSLGLVYRYSISSSAQDADSLHPIDEFMKIVRKSGVKVFFRINGQFRRYVLHARPEKRWEVPQPDAAA